MHQQHPGNLTPARSSHVTILIYFASLVYRLNGSVLSNARIYVAYSEILFCEITS